MPVIILEPPQGFDSGRELLGVGQFYRAFFTPPQGLDIAIPAELLLDLFPGAKVAYSLRRLNSSYSGSAIRVKNSVTLQQEDIGFLPDGNLDVASLLSFISGAADGEIIIFYDQSGNGIDLDADPVSDFTPRIVITGALQTVNNLPAINFDGLQDVLFSTNSLPTPASHLFIFGVWQKKFISAQGENFNLNFPDFLDRVSANAPFSDGTIFWDAGNGGVDRLSTSAAFNDTLQHIWTFMKTAGINNQKILRDGIQLAQQTQVSSSTVLGKVGIGAEEDPSTTNANMDFQELVFYDTDQLANFPAIQDNVELYWKLLTITTEVEGIPIATEGGQVILAQ